MKQNKGIEHCVVLTDSPQIVVDCSVTVTQKLETVQCHVRSDNGHNLEGSIGHGDTE